MSRKEVLFSTILFVFFSFFAANVVVRHLTNESIFALLRKDEVSILEESDSCSDESARTGTDESSEIHVQKLAEYEAACQSKAVDSLMVFTDMPISSEEAIAKAAEMTTILREFETYGISPIVIVEPDSSWGLIDFEEFQTGFYDQWLRDYFEQLKLNGVSNSMMGLWIPFPEANQPFWNNNESRETFALNVNQFLRIQKEFFPESEGGFLLDSAVVSAAGDAAPRIPSLLAYTRLIDTELVDVIGLQGFPFIAPPQSGERDITEAEAFLPQRQINEFAEQLGTKRLLINTGTFRKKITPAPEGSTINVSASTRQTILRSLSDHLENLQNDGFELTVNIFSENKLDDGEQTDWSYWESGSAESSTQTQLFINLMASLNSAGYNTAIHDKVKPNQLN